MAYADHFSKKFSQGTMIQGVLDVANKKAGLNSTAGGVCALMTLVWFVKSLDAGSPEKGFDALAKQDVKSGTGAAFWTQVCGAFKGVQINTDGALSGGEGLRSEALLILSNKKWKLPYKGKGASWNAVKNGTAADGYYYLGLQHVLGTSGGHAVGLYRNSGAFVLMDPNFGLVIDLIGLIGLDTVLSDMWTYYQTSQGCDVYMVDAQ